MRGRKGRVLSVEWVRAVGVMAIYSRGGNRTKADITARRGLVVQRLRCDPAVACGGGRCADIAA
eukprot:973441-Pelagomonas_calceolata.AAC.6